MTDMPAYEELMALEDIIFKSECAGYIYIKPKPAHPIHNVIKPRNKLYSGARSSSHLTNKLKPKRPKHKNKKSVGIKPITYRIKETAFPKIPFSPIEETVDIPDKYGFIKNNFKIRNKDNKQNTTPTPRKDKSRNTMEMLSGNNLVLFLMIGILSQN